MPTEAEWELAAPSGLASAALPWAGKPRPEGHRMVST
ncbi:SUMF1/EgtB/PvdO family nonheme iron enzyme [Kitasatospora sp. NPDC059571]